MEMNDKIRLACFQIYFQIHTSTEKSSTRTENSSTKLICDSDSIWFNGYRVANRSICLASSGCGNEMSLNIYCCVAIQPKGKIKRTTQNTWNDNEHCGISIVSFFISFSLSIQLAMFDASTNFISQWMATMAYAMKRTV